MSQGHGSTPRPPLPLPTRLHARITSSRWVPGVLRERSTWFSGTSLDYHLVGFDDAARTAVAANGGWTSAAVARRQHEIWQELLDGEADDRVDVGNIRTALALVSPVESLLEVGCGSGYLSLFIAEFDPAIRYVGVDRSVAAVSLASTVYPWLSLCAADATGLPLLDRSHDVVLDGGALAHIPQWEETVREECRVAREAVVFHTVTITDTTPTAYFTKRAYGYVVPELALSRSEFTAAIRDNGFECTATFAGIDYDLEPMIGIPTSSETWVCRRR